MCHVEVHHGSHSSLRNVAPRFHCGVKLLGATADWWYVGCIYTFTNRNVYTLCIYVRIYRFVHTFTNLNTLADLNTYLDYFLHIYKSDYVHTDSRHLQIPVHIGKSQFSFAFRDSFTHLQM